MTWEHENVLTYASWRPHSSVLPQNEGNETKGQWLLPFEEAFPQGYDQGQVRSSPVPGPEGNILPNDAERTRVGTGHRWEKWQPVLWCPWHVSHWW